MPGRQPYAVVYVHLAEKSEAPPLHHLLYRAPPPHSGVHTPHHPTPRAGRLRTRPVHIIYKYIYDLYRNYVRREEEAREMERSLHFCNCLLYSSSLSFFPSSLSFLVFESGFSASVLSLSLSLFLESYHLYPCGNAELQDTEEFFSPFLPAWRLSPSPRATVSLAHSISMYMSISLSLWLYTYTSRRKKYLSLRPMLCLCLLLFSLFLSPSVLSSFLSHCHSSSSSSSCTSYSSSAAQIPLPP